MELYDMFSAVVGMGLARVLPDLLKTPRCGFYTHQYGNLQQYFCACHNSPILLLKIPISLLCTMCTICTIN